MNNDKKSKLSKINFFLSGMIIILFMVLYWVFDVIVDVFVFQDDTFLESCFSPDPMCLVMRLINLPIILICLVVVQWMYFKHKAVENELKKLREILPVCMYCKNIRDDTGTELGKGEWLPIEEYLNAKDGTKASHTFCPQCRERAEKDMLGD